MVQYFHIAGRFQLGFAHWVFPGAYTWGIRSGLRPLAAGPVLPHPKYPFLTQRGRRGLIRHDIWPYFDNERRLRTLNSPNATHGQVICRGRNSHLGCIKLPGHRCGAGAKVTFRNFETACAPLNIYLARGGGVQGEQKNTG